VLVIPRRRRVSSWKKETQGDIMAAERYGSNKWLVMGAELLCWD
jgi:hypothetical protein